MRDLSDPISRQQTITALRALSDEDGYINAPHEVVTDVVRGLPPVRAEHEQTAPSEQTKTDKSGVKTGETCEDCISRQAAIDAIWKIRRELQMLDDTHKADRVMHGIYLAKKALEQLPSAPERKTGKWIYDGDSYKCNKCGTVYGWWADSQTSNFCPNCGADMRQSSV